MLDSRFIYQSSIPEGDRIIEFNDLSRAELHKLSFKLKSKIQPERGEYPDEQDEDLQDITWMQLSRAGERLCMNLPNAIDVMKHPYLKICDNIPERGYPDFQDLTFSLYGQNKVPDFTIRNKIGVPMLTDRELVRAFSSFPEDSGPNFDDFERQIKRTSKGLYLLPSFARVTVSFTYDQWKPGDSTLTLSVRDKEDFTFDVASEITFKQLSGPIVYSNGVQTREYDSTEGQLLVFRNSALAILYSISRFEENIASMHSEGLAKPTRIRNSDKV